MVETSLQDLLGLDRDVGRAVAGLERWRKEVAAHPEVDAQDPFTELRRVTAKSTWDKLGDLSVGEGDEPLRAGLRRWIYVLVQTRLGGADDLAGEREAATPRGRFEGEQVRLVTWREAWRGVVHAKTAAEGRRWLTAAAEAAAPLADANRIRAERRAEIAHRFGFAHPWDAVVAPAAHAGSGLRGRAARLLDATEDISRAVWKESLRGRDRADAAEILHSAMAREAADGWPARLTARWLLEMFGGGVRGLRIDLPALPAVLGAASFARGLRAFGFALRVATAPSGLPFVLRREPGFVAAHRLALLFGALAADPEFHVRTLGLSRGRALAQCRVLARTALLDARVQAARILLGDEEALAPRDVFDEVGARTFGEPLDARLRGAWPAAREDEPARWVALLQVPALRRTMRERFDEDWFRNPRGWSFIRAQGAGPAHEPFEEGGLDAAVDSLALAFEDALG